jgi:hypothetical protein
MVVHLVGRGQSQLSQITHLQAAHSYRLFKV